MVLAPTPQSIRPDRKVRPDYRPLDVPGLSGAPLFLIGRVVFSFSQHGGAREIRTPAVPVVSLVPLSVEPFHSGLVFPEAGGVIPRALV